MAAKRESKQDIQRERDIWETALREQKAALEKKLREGAATFGEKDQITALADLRLKVEEVRRRRL